MFNERYSPLDTDYCTAKGLERLHSFNINFKLKKWCSEKAIYNRNVKDYPLYTTSRILGKCQIPVINIVGTSHVNYAEKTWLQVLGNLKRFENKWTKENFLEFTQSDSFHSGLSFDKYGEIYCVGQGNHRTCQIKFSELEYVTVDVTEHILNTKLSNIFNKLSQYNLVDTNDYRGINFHQEMQWSVKLNGKHILIKNSYLVEEFINVYETTKVTLKNLLKAKVNLTLYNKKSDYFYNIIIDNTDKLIQNIIEHKINHINTISC